MKNESDIDWLQATEDQRKQLYVATRATADAAGISVEEILDAALGRKFLMGTDYISTFRRGKIRRSYAKLVHAWIIQNHADTAGNIAPNLFGIALTEAWDHYLIEHAITGSLRIATFDKSMGLVERARKQPKPEYVLKLEEEFCFHFDSNSDGYAVAFQEYGGEMHPLPLGQDEQLITPIKAGEQFLPLGEDGRPDALSEEKDIGHHRFIIVIAKHEGDLPTENRPPSSNVSALTHAVRVQFVAK